MADINDTLPALKDSVQDVTYEKDRVWAPGGAIGGMWLVGRQDENSILPPWNTYRRDLVLRAYSRAMHNGLFMSTLNNLGAEIASTPWQLYGKRNKDAYQKLLMNAEFGMGWRSFCQKYVTTRGTSDLGVPIEVIGKGDALKPITGQVEGFGILDPLYCELTGNVQFPIIYQSERGGYHRMHSSRVRRIVDNPQPDRDAYGRGICALSRFFGTMWLQILMGRYNVEKLSDLPPAGIAILNNIAGKFSDIVAAYEADRRRDGQSVYRNVMEIENFDSNKEAGIDFISFSQLPEQFDYEKFEKSHINLVALAIGVDPQDVAPLTGAAMGTGAQSFVLDAKSRRKAPGLILKELETFINLDVLPAYLEFKFVPRDEEGELREAETAQAWVNVVNSVPGMTDEQKLQLLVAKVQAVQDVMTDKQGNLLFVDSDVPDTSPQEDIVPADDTTTPGTDVNDSAPTADTNSPVTQAVEQIARKAYSSTRKDFEDRVALIIDASVAGDAGRLRAGVDMRSALDEFGTLAMLDGLADGGTATDALEGDDLKTFNTWKVEQSAYVATLMADIFKDGAEPNGESRARIWANKSLNTIYQKGLLAADANGFYEWVYGGTKEHCSTCAKNVGKIMRLKWWHEKECLPQGDCLECGGYNCLCSLKRRRKKMLDTVVRWIHGAVERIAA